MKDKLRKLAKAEMKKRKLIPKSSIIIGNEIIKSVRSSNNLPPLPEQFASLDTIYNQEGAQAFYFIAGCRFNRKTDPQLREALQKHLGQRLYIGGIVSGCSHDGRRVLLEYPKILHVLERPDDGIEIIDSHLWLELKQCTYIKDKKSRTISLGDFLIVEGTPLKYFSKEEERYSLGDWGIIASGLLASKLTEPIRIKEDYYRTGWIFRLNVIDFEKKQKETSTQSFSEIKCDERQLTDIFKSRVIVTTQKPW